MIRNIITTSRNTEASDVLVKLINAFNTSTLTEDPHLIVIFEELQSKSTQILAAIKYSKAESKLEAADLLRDNKLRGLFFGVKSALYNSTLETRTAAEKLDKILGNYTLDIIDDSYASESSLLRSLLNDLAKPEQADAIALVPGCAMAIAQLQAAQDAFTATSDTFEKDKSHDAKQLSATVLKKQIVSYVNLKLVKYLNGMQAVNDAQYGALTNNIAQIIADNNRQVRKRGDNDN